MSAQKQQNSFPLRLPDELRAKLEARAKQNGRSANSEIVTMLTAALDADSDLGSVPDGILLDEVIARYGARLKLVISPDAAERPEFREHLHGDE